MPQTKKTQSKKPAKKPENKKSPQTPPTRRPRHEVEIDEPRQRAGDGNEIAFKLETSEGTDALAEELGEEYVENVTGANDSASEHREEEMLEEQGSFIVTDSETEFAHDVDASNPPDAEPAPLPSATARP
jgi:hypothetical protein